MQIKAANVDAYIAQLPEDRREAIETLRRVINKHIDKKFEEGIQYGMIGYYLPHSVYPDGYHCDPKQPLPFVGIGNQKNHIGIYLFCIYIDEGVQREFVEGWKKSGKKLDMGKGCVRVKKLDDVALDVLGKTIKKVKLKDFVAMYEKAIPASKRKK
jgi:uncharacterized protein YdhG (YjbR/CyaY superfamily)